MYTYEYKAVLDGVETDSMMEINPAKQLEILKVGNGSEEVLEIHDFRNVSVVGLTCNSKKNKLNKTQKHMEDQISLWIIHINGYRWDFILSEPEEI